MSGLALAVAVGASLFTALSGPNGGRPRMDGELKRTARNGLLPLRFVMRPFFCHGGVTAQPSRYRAWRAYRRIGARRGTSEV